MRAAVGGIFLATRDVPRLVAWYRGLGLPLDDGGTIVQGGDGLTFQAAAGIVFSIMPAHQDLAAPAVELREEPYGRQAAMVNLRVERLADTLAHLRARGHEVAGPRDYGYGLFAWTKDPDGNLVEMWEPQAIPITDAAQ